MMRRAGLAIAVLTLAVGPWIALPSFAARPAPLFAASGIGRGLVGTSGEPRILAAQGQARRLGAVTGCTCREIVVEAKNVVRDVEVSSGDAEVVNTNITYITPTFDDTDVEIDQEAEARSGDAIAGQIIGVDAGTNGCARVRVSATNIVEDAEVSSGDAIARNRSVVLLDPSIDRGDLDIDVDQDADAESGLALAGQVIGVKGVGGPCGGVILDALNRVRDVEVESGDAITENLSEILACENVRCLREVLDALGDVRSVTVCDDTGCHDVRTGRFIKMMKESLADDVDGDIWDDEVSIDDADDDADDETADERRKRRKRRHRKPPDDIATDTAVESPEPSPSPPVEEPLV